MIKRILKRLTKKNIMILSLGFVFLISGLVGFTIFGGKTFKNRVNDSSKLAMYLKPYISIDPNYIEINRELNDPNKKSSINNIGVKIENIGEGHKCISKNIISDYTIKVVSEAHGTKEEIKNSQNISEKGLDCNIMYFDLDIDSLYFADELPYYLSVNMTINGKEYTSNTVKISFDSDTDVPVISNAVTLSIKGDKITAQTDIEDIIKIYSVDSNGGTSIIGDSGSKAQTLDIDKTDLAQGWYTVYAETNLGKSEIVYFQNYIKPTVNVDPGFPEPYNNYAVNVGEDVVIPITINGGYISSPMYDFDTSAVKKYIYLKDNTTGQEFSVKGFDKIEGTFESYKLILNPFYNEGEFTLVVKKGFAINDNNVESEEAAVKVKITNIEIALEGKSKGQIFLGTTDNGEEFATIYSGTVTVHKVGPNASLYKKDDNNEYQFVGEISEKDKFKDDGWYKIEILNGNGEVTLEKYFVISNTTPKINIKNNEYNSISTYTNEDIQIPIVIENGKLSKNIDNIVLGSDIYSKQNTTNDRIEFKNFEKVENSENEYLLTIGGIKNMGDVSIFLPEGFVTNEYNEKSEYTSILINVYKPEIVQLSSSTNYIKNIYSGTTINKFKEEVEKIIDNSDLSNIEVSGAKGNTNNVGTGSTFEIDGEEYTVIIAGEVNGDGKISVSDISATIDKVNSNEIGANYFAAQLNKNLKLDIDESKSLNVTNISREIDFVNKIISGGN